MIEPFYQSSTATLFCGDCRDVLAEGTPVSQVAAVICDPPYGTTDCDWDTVVDLGFMWDMIDRVIVTGAPIVLCSAQPFTTDLILSRRKWFRYEWIWDKIAVTGFLSAKKRPLRRHENICIFCERMPLYNPQMTKGKPYVSRRSKEKQTEVYNCTDRIATINRGDRYPTSIIEFPSAQMDPEQKGQHPTQKPIELMAFLILTYSNPGDVVLDFTMGSGTTGVACVKTGRKFIGIEISEEYCAIAAKRIREAESQPMLGLDAV